MHEKGFSYMLSVWNLTTTVSQQWITFEFWWKHHSYITSCHLFIAPIFPHFGSIFLWLNNCRCVSQNNNTDRSCSSMIKKHHVACKALWKTIIQPTSRKDHKLFIGWNETCWYNIKKCQLSAKSRWPIRSLKNTTKHKHQLLLPASD